jgi:RND family efflux transporter MFP subunit
MTSVLESVPAVLVRGEGEVLKGTPELPGRRGWWRRWPWLGWLVFAVAGFGLGRYLAVEAKPHRSPLTLDSRAARPPLAGEGIVVTTAPVVYRTVQRTVEAVGSLHGFEEVTLSSKIDGRVLRIHHDVASVVRPGELLLELDATDARLAVEQAERSVQAELARWGFREVPVEGADLDDLPLVVSARLRYELARSRLERLLPLLSTQSVSVDDLEQARSEAQVSESEWKNQALQAQSAAATARLRQAELAIAQQRVHDAEIRSPLPTITDDGSEPSYTISERLVSEGSFLRTGTEVFRLLLGKNLKLRLAVPEVHAAQVQPGQAVMLTSAGLPTAVRGQVTRISPAIDRITRSFQVEVLVPNDQGGLKPGSFAKASIIVGEDDQASTIPLAGLYSFAGIHKVFAAEGGVAHEYQVTLGEQADDWVEIVAPKLPSGAAIITSGQRLLSEGIPVIERAAGTAPPAETATAGAARR